MHFLSLGRSVGKRKKTRKNKIGKEVCMCILNWPLPIGAFQDQCKQTMINKYSNEHNHVKNPNWQEANQLAIYKSSREVEFGATENNIS